MILALAKKHFSKQLLVMEQESAQTKEHYQWGHCSHPIQERLREHLILETQADLC